MVVIFTLGNSSDAFLILRAQDAGLTVMGMLLTFNLVYTLVSSPAGALSDRLGHRRLPITGWLVYAAVYLGFSQITVGWQAWAVLAGAGYSSLARVRLRRVRLSRLAGALIVLAVTLSAVTSVLGCCAAVLCERLPAWKRNPTTWPAASALSSRPWRLCVCSDLAAT
jgi:MFS family permease